MSGRIAELLHPLSVPSHVLALLALGLLVGQRDAGRRALPLAAFVAGLAAGLAAIALALGPTAAADGLLAIAALAGLLVALASPVPTILLALLMAAGGLALGMDSPPQAISIAIGNLTLLATAIGAFLIVAAVAACTNYLTAAWQRIGIRIVGSWIAASAILVLALELARTQLR